MSSELHSFRMLWSPRWRPYSHPPPGATFTEGRFMFTEDASDSLKKMMERSAEDADEDLPLSSRLLRLKVQQPARKEEAAVEDGADDDDLPLRARLLKKEQNARKGEELGDADSKTQRGKPCPSYVWSVGRYRVEGFLDVGHAVTVEGPPASGSKSRDEGRGAETLEVYVFNRLIQERKKAMGLETLLAKQQALSRVKLAADSKRLAELRIICDRLQKDRDSTELEVEEIKRKLKSEGEAKLEQERELTRARQELARLRGQHAEDMEMHELAELENELQETLQESLRRVKNATRRRNAVEKLASTSDSFMCPIGHELFQDPVVAADGHTYERSKIEEWIRRKGRDVLSPKTLQPLAHTMLIPNHAIKNSMDEAIELLMLECELNETGVAPSGSSAKRQKR